ncbi:MAG: TorD/DmsD family molecular chaperone [Rubripirellula sp.]
MAESARGDAMAIASVYALLSRIWIREIDRAMLSAMRAPDLSTALSSLGISPPDETLEDLAIEYCRLFIGPRDHLPPIQSVWQKSQLEGESATSVKKFAELAGYDMPFGVIQDQLGIELAVMGRLVEAATKSDDVSESVDDRDVVDRDVEADAARDAAAMFFSRHLTWVSPLLLATAQRAELPFYRSIAEVTQQFLVLEREDWLGSSRSE